MPSGVKRDPNGSGWVVYELNTGRIKSHHDSKRKAEISRSIRDRARKKGRAHHAATRALAGR